MRLLILSDFVPDENLVLSSGFEKLIQDSERVIFNLEGSPQLKEEKHNVPNQIMPFNVDTILNFVEKYGKEKFHVSLANNHILDNKEAGLDFLISTLKFHNISFFGTKEVPGTTIEDIKVLNFVTAETVAKKNAGKKRLNYLFYNAKKINKQIARFEQKSDKLILYPHWGRDMDTQIFKTYDDKLKFSKKWFVFGHHPHVISGVEEGRIYSMGNNYIPHPYYFDRYPAIRYGLAIVFDSEKLKYKIHTTVLEKKQDKYVIEAIPFYGLPTAVKDHGKNFGKMKRLFLNVFAFKGTALDVLKLNALQLMTFLFELKYRRSGDRS